MFDIIVILQFIGNATTSDNKSNTKDAYVNVYDVRNHAVIALDSQRSGTKRYFQILPSPPRSVHVHYSEKQDEVIKKESILKETNKESLKYK